MIERTDRNNISRLASTEAATFDKWEASFKEFTIQTKLINWLGLRLRLLGEVTIYVMAHSTLVDMGPILHITHLCCISSAEEMSGHQ